MAAVLTCTTSSRTSSEGDLAVVAAEDRGMRATDGSGEVDFAQIDSFEMVNLIVFFSVLRLV